jgi:hypothetical protein
MIRFDFDVVSDPLPLKPIKPPAADPQADRERRSSESRPASGAEEDLAVGGPGKGR